MQNKDVAQESQSQPRAKSAMAVMRSKGGAGCALAVLAILIGTGLFVSYKFKLLWWKEKPPPASGKEMQVHVLDVGEGDSILIIANQQDGHLVIFDAIYRGVELPRRGALLLIVAVSHQLDLPKHCRFQEKF